MIATKAHHIWHPASQMKDYATFPLLDIVAARGAYFELRDGRKILDAISSWWCKLLGHQHPRLKQALLAQLEKFEHVILAGTTNETIMRLSEKLAALMPTLNKVFYANDGSSAIEIALKMSLQARKNQGDARRNIFLTLENSYHGETVGALSVSDVGRYRAQYQDLLFHAPIIKGLPYVCGTHDPLWNNCEEHWEKILPQLNTYSETATAIIVEPLVQGVGGMKIYSQDFLARLRAWTREHNIHLIADEIMTGIARTGKMLACQHANIEVDFLCLGKALTAGWLPLSAVLTTQTIYDVFYDDAPTEKSFLHSHTYSGNALAVAVALETLTICEQENICQLAEQVGATMHQHMRAIAEETRLLHNVRTLGAITAADLVHVDGVARRDFEIHRRALAQGVLMRPLGNTIYWLPPLNIENEALELLKNVTQNALKCGMAP